SLDLTLSGTDVEGSALTFAIVSGPAHGTLSGTGISRSYLPALNFTGADAFTFKVNDGTVDSAPVTVSITVTPVNDAPVATPQSVTTAEDTSSFIALAGADVEGSSLGFVIVTQPAHGSLSGAAANPTYSPAANYAGPDSFTFKVNDGALDSASATVAITVTPVNDAPVAAGKSVSFTTDDASVEVLLSGTDVEGDVLTFRVVDGPSRGSLSGTAPALVYTPSGAQPNVDTFTYVVNDGTSDSAPATVTVTRNQGTTSNTGGGGGADNEPVVSAYAWPGCSSTPVTSLLPLALLVLVRRRKQLLGAAVAAVAFVAAPALAETKSKLAVSSLRAMSGVHEGEADVFTERLVSEIRALKAYEVISSSDVSTMLGYERQKQMMGCSESSCTMEIANALNADRITFGSLSRLGDSLLLDVTLMDVAKGRAVVTVSRRYEGSRLDEALDDLPSVARECAQADGKTFDGDAPTSARVRRWEVGAKVDADILGPAFVPSVTVAYTTRFVAVMLTGIVSARPGGRLEARIYPIKTKRLWPFATVGVTGFAHGLAARGGLGLQMPLSILRINVEVAYERFLVKTPATQADALVSGIGASLAF
ncbi:MAG: tandem-95 repeat protein, partial [Archangium sp.]|nr:tandem-95 repeat protein [Archangium sp.]